MKTYGRVMSRDNEEWCKVWRKADSSFQKLHKEFGEFQWEQWKVWKTALFDVLLFSIAYKVFQLKKCRRIISHDTEKRSKLWRKTDFLFEKWHEEFGEL